MQTTLGQQNALGLTDENSNTPAMNDTPSKFKLPFENTVSLNSLLFIAAISLLTAGLVFGAWWCDIFIPLQAVLFGTRWTVSDQSLIMLPVWLVAVILVTVGLIVGFLVERMREEKIGYYLAGALLCWFLGGAFAAHEWKIDLLSIPGIIVGTVTYFALEIRFRANIEKRLTESIRRLAMSAHLLEGKRAESRMTSGLQLLETVLPVDEIVIFQLGKDGKWTSVGRTQDTPTDKIIGKPKHAEWREGIELCDEVLKTKMPAVQRISGLPGAARVAVPLIHEGEALGALLVKFRKNFELADKNVLTAFASQLARNFHRQRNSPAGQRETAFRRFFAERSRTPPRNVSPDQRHFNRAAVRLARVRRNG